MPKRNVELTEAGMDDHQGRLGTRAVRGAGPFRRSCTGGRMDLLDRTYDHGPHGCQGTAHGREDSLT